jgi:hypothetical protein
MKTVQNIIENIIDKTNDLSVLQHRLVEIRKESIEKINGLIPEGISFVYSNMTISKGAIGQSLIDHVVKDFQKFLETLHEAILEKNLSIGAEMVAHYMVVNQL